jgi:hypothetical protein
MLTGVYLIDIFCAPAFELSFPVTAEMELCTHGRFHVMNMQSKKDATAHGRGRGRVITGVLVGAAVIVWIVAATLVWVVAPLLEADAAVAESPESVPPLAMAVASLASGLALVLGVAVNWFAPHRAVGRSMLLIGGLMVAMSGALLANDALESGWSGLAAVLGIAFGLLQLLVGLFAWVASLSDWLPGCSLVKHMWATEPVPPRAGARQGMLLLTAAVTLGWLFCALAVVTRFDMERTGMVAWFVAVWGMPILAGMLVAGWRDTEPNRLQSLGLAALTGVMLDLLYLLVLGLWYYRFNPIGFAPWWAIMGAIFGATGFALWGLLVRRAPRLHLHPR